MKSKIMKMMVAALALASFGLMGCDTTVKDADGNSYPTVKIGNQVWMAKNLNVNVPGSMCYENDPANCEKYGRLYTWESAKKACPAGWRLPSVAEFKGLLDIAGGEIRSLNLRARSWENGSDKFGFSALPAGYYRSDYKKFYNVGSYAGFWSSTESKGDFAYSLGVNDDNAIVSRDDKDDAYSVRCLQDSSEGGEASSQRSEAQPPSGTLKDSRDGQTYKTVKIGNQVWMAKNLNVNVPGSMCYDNKPENCEKYGRLYTWDAAKKACPTGWHLPSKEEFERLLDIAGGAGGINLRARSWRNESDKFGFSALPAGYYGNCSEKFCFLGRSTFIWSSTEVYNRRGDFIHAYNLGIYDNYYAYVYYYDKSYGSSVRCLKD